jgi:DNA-binding NarL/FixJ family response regulator
MLNFVILEDDLIYRSMLEMSINSQSEWRCLLSCASIEEFKANFPLRARIDFALLDIELEGETGIDAIPFLTVHSPNTNIVMLTSVDERDVLMRALNKGATGYLLKDFPVSTLPEVIQTAIDGGALISPLMARHLIDYFNPPKRKPYEQDILTTKEHQVLRRLADGKTYEEIAMHMSISKDGVRYHVRNIYSKLNVKKRADAVRKWQEN